MSTRPSRDAMFMAIAEIVATRGTCPRKQVGAVLVRENRIISIGYNGAPPGMAHCTDVGCGGGHLYYEPGDHKCSNPKWDYPNGCTRAIHAEINTINFSARHGVPTDDSTMYSTCATCRVCAQSLVAAGITRFVYREPYRLTDGIDLLDDAGVEVSKWMQQ